MLWTMASRYLKWILRQGHADWERRENKELKSKNWLPGIRGKDMDG